MITDVCVIASQLVSIIGGLDLRSRSISEEQNVLDQMKKQRCRGRCT